MNKFSNFSEIPIYNKLNLTLNEKIFKLEKFISIPFQKLNTRFFHFFPLFFTGKWIIKSRVILKSEFNVVSGEHSWTIYYKLPPP